jgi:S1-C subfamily serine protease
LLCGLLVLGCEHDRATTEPGATVAAPVGAGQCSALGELADLEFALAGGTAPSSRVGTHPLARTDEELAYLEVALGELQAGDDLAPTLTALREAMFAHRAELARSTAAAAESYAVAQRALDEAALCRGVDLRERALAKEREIADSVRCRSARRLWAAFEDVDLTSPVSSRGAATHTAELTLEPERAALRDRIGDALLAHATNLQVVELAADFSASHETPAKRELALERIDAVDRITRARIRCLEGIRPTPRVVSRYAEPRAATVVVRPKWPSAVEAMHGGGGSFGSGFVVHWQAKDGSTETRVVTNNHVMGGALEAEIVPGDEAEKPGRRGEEEEPPLVAKLVVSVPRDDIAILRVETSPRARTLLPAGIGFRLDPAREREKVTAAGFPGVSGSPSFQVTEGIVSNARFAAAEHDPRGVAAFIQHTAAIDPGNSGGPLLDAGGRLLGMNAIKIVGRENVGLAIPTARIQIAMAQADEQAPLNLRHAEAACNMAIAALANPAPGIEETQRFGVSLHEAFDAWSRSPEAARHRDRIVGEAWSGLELVRSRLYAGVKASLDAHGGVVPYTTCSDIAEADTSGATPRFVASFRTTESVHRIVLAEEGGSLRVAELALP